MIAVNAPAPTTSKTARHVPTFSWSSPRQWTTSPRPIAVLLGGLVLFGVGDWMLVASRFGNSPWTVLAEGIDTHLGIGIGTVTVLVSLVVLLGWIPLRQRPGLGTIANALVVGTVVEVLQRNGPTAESTAARVALMVGGVAVVGAGGALYLSSRLGPGPRDGWMTGIGTRFDWPIARVRLGIEVTVLVLGWLLGGRVGVATFLFAATIGHSLAFCVAQLTRLDQRNTAARSI
jgi:uncharacterized protein